MDYQDLFLSYRAIPNSKRSMKKLARVKLSIILKTRYSYTLSQSAKLLKVSVTTVQNDLNQFKDGIFDHDKPANKTLVRS